MIHVERFDELRRMKPPKCGPAPTPIVRRAEALMERIVSKP